MVVTPGGMSITIVALARGLGGHVTPTTLNSSVSERNSITHTLLTFIASSRSLDVVSICLHSGFHNSWIPIRRGDDEIVESGHTGYRVLTRDEAEEY